MCVQLYSFISWIFITTDFIDLEHRPEKLLGNAVNAASRSSNVDWGDYCGPSIVLEPIFKL